MKDTMEIANLLADELEKRSQPGDMWMAVAARTLVDTHLTEIRQALIEAGICPDCLQAPQHHYDEPFSTCACGTGEDYGERPMQRLQRLESAMPDAEQMEDIRDLVSLGGTHAEMVVTRGMYGNAPFTQSRMQDLAWGGYARAFGALDKMKGVARD